MPEEPGEKRYASPYSTGGGGFELEHMLGALLMTRLLTGGAVTHLDERTPETVAFQQVPAALADDIVVTAAAADGVTTLRLDIAVRRSPRFNVSDPSTSALVTTLVKADLAAEQNEENLVHRLCVAVSGRQSHAQQLAELADVATGKSNAADFYNDIATPGKYALNPRLTQLTNMVGNALDAIGDPTAGTKQDRTLRLLQRLRIWQVNLEEGHEDDWTRMVTDLTDVAIDQTQESARALRDRLTRKAADLAIVSANLDRQNLRRILHGQLAPATGKAPPGWALLKALDEQTRTNVTGVLAGGADDELRLPRTTARDRLQAALQGGNVLVVGDSGVGKSALVLDATTDEALGSDTQALAVNLRHLPKTSAELLGLLGGRLAVLLGEMTAPRRTLVIDAAEAAAEGHDDVLRLLAADAVKDGTTVVAVSTTEGAVAVKELLKAAGVDVTEHHVDGLDDSELDIVAEQYPSLQRLATDTRSRELLRRPIVVDLLRSAADPGLPLSEAQALEQIWKQLVRNMGRTQAGMPAAREEVMLQLAEHAVRGGEAADLTRQLDPEAVEGLRKSGLLRPVSPYPWERTPEFRHDLIRAYAIARRLLTAADPAAALTALGAPRWTLPAARLACEVLLAAPGGSSLPLAGRFQRLQAGFETLGEATGSQRWKDVPTEALLVTPEPGPVLEDAWPYFTGGDAAGVKRLIRVMRGRHRREGLTDPAAAAPVIAQLLATDIPDQAGDDAAELITNWLQALVAAQEPVGNSLRTQLRDQIVQQCAENQCELAEEDAKQAVELAARTPEEVEAEAADSKLFNIFGFSSPGRRRRRRQGAHRTYEWISDSVIEQLSLLGPDLGDDGEKILRQIAADDPGSLDHCIETTLAGFSLASHSTKLLADLTLAYYRDEREDDGFGFAGLGDDGIRRHRNTGGALRGYLLGPFLALFRTDYRRGVVVLNQLLDHAARARVQIPRDLSRSLAPPDENADPDSGAEATGTVLKLTDVEREYAGDAQVWPWYRGTGTGPYPCMSALMALELVTDENIRAGVAPRTLTDLMLADANNLAMPALALSVLIRHLEAAEYAIDAFLVEPAVWQLEFGRATHEGSMLAAATPEATNPERRRWTLKDVSAYLAIRSTGERSDELRTLGSQLEANARAWVGDDTSQDAAEFLASVRQWAACLDRDQFDVSEHPEGLLFQLAADPAVEEVLGEGNEQRRRVSEAVGLANRYCRVRDNGGRAPDTDADTLTADLGTARNLLTNPIEPRELTINGPVGVAAAAVELHLTGRTAVEVADVTWAVTVMLDIADEFAGRPDQQYDSSYFDQAADRSAARALPYLLLPGAASLRAELRITSPDELDELIRLLRAVGVTGSDEGRLAFARSLDAIWDAPCNVEHLAGRCHHTIAFDLATESYLPSRLGDWDPETQRTSIVNVDPPSADGLTNTDDDKIVVERLTPALRAFGSAAASAACCAADSSTTLTALLDAHRRGVLAHEGFDQSHNDALVAARAALRQAASGDGDVLLGHVAALLGNAKVLSEALDAVSVAAGESQEVGALTLQLWPAVMDVVLEAAETTPLFKQPTWGKYADAAVVPAPTSAWGYQPSELAGDPVNWRNLMALKPQMDRWVAVTFGGHNALVHLVAAVSELSVTDQLEHGLRWIEQAVGRAGDECATTSSLPQWLRDRRGDLTGDDQTARWQRIVDRLVEAGDPRVADLAD